MRRFEYKDAKSGKF